VIGVAAAKDIPNSQARTPSRVILMLHRLLSAFPTRS